MQSVNIAIIGCGAATKRYYVPALKKKPDLVRNLCLVDKNKDLAIELSKELNGGHVFVDYKEVIDRIQGAIIVLPNFLHYKVSMDFLKSGVNVLCEKPLAETVEEVSDLIKTANENNVSLCVNNTRRMFPSFSAIKNVIDNGQIGALRSISYTEGNTFAWPSETGFYVDPSVSSKGILSDLGPHVLDLICWWLGSKPSVTEYEDDSFGGPESVGNIKAVHKNCDIEIFLNRLCDIDCQYEIKGEKGVIKGDVFEWDRYLISNNFSDFVEKKVSCGAKTYPDFVIPIVDNFIDVVKRNTKPLIAGHDVKNSIEFIEECYQKRTHFHLPWYEDIKTGNIKTKGKILVTGATGFIGGSIVETMQLSKAGDVRAAIHQWASAARIGRFPIEIVQMDLMDRNSIESAMESVTEIIHCAKGPAGVTVQGTRNLLEISFKMGIKRFVHLSTAEIYGEVTGEITEDAPFQYTGNEYNKTKIEAEKLCWEFYEKGLPVTIIRPAIVYGPFSKNWSIHFATMLLEGKWGLYETIGEGTCNLIYIDDLVSIIIDALTNENAVGQAFNITGPEVVTWNEYFEMYNSKLGMPKLKKISSMKAKYITAMQLPVRKLGSIVKNHFMTPVKKIAATFDFADQILRHTEKTLKTTPCFDELTLFGKKAHFLSEKAEKNFKVRVTTSVNEGLEKTIEWLRHQRIAK